MGDRYEWPAASDEELTITCSRIARHLSRAGARIIGLLPVAGPLAAAAPLAPFLSRLGEALAGFLDGDIALIDGWPTWTEPTAKAGEAPRAATAGMSRLQEIHPHVLAITPPPCPDATAALEALRSTVGVLRGGAAAVLINLGGYAPAGVAPAPLLLVDGVVMLVARRHTRRAAVASLLEHVAPAKRLGAILVG